MFGGCCKDAPPGKYSIRLGLQRKQNAFLGADLFCRSGFWKGALRGTSFVFLELLFFALILRGIDKKSVKFFLLYRLPPISR